MLVKTKLLYITCRAKGWSTAKKEIESVLEHFVESRHERRGEITVRFKCQVSVSLVDCFCLAVGYLHGLPVYFMAEKELEDDKIRVIREDPGIDLRILRKII